LQEPEKFAIDKQKGVPMPGFYEVCVKANFSAAHFLRDYPGDCARLHGHNWDVEVFVRCEKLNELGIAVDFRDIKQALREALRDFDHMNLNDLSVFRNQNPSSENISRILYRDLSGRLNSARVKVSKVHISETPSTGAFYWEE
jgi:6-pyruvoyltetrahydropterin/6-carboxytetrahydropterin synthase